MAIEKLDTDYHTLVENKVKIHHFKEWKEK